MAHAVEAHVVIRGAWAMALLAVGCVQIIDLEVGRPREVASTSGGSGGANSGGQANGGGGSCNEGGGPTDAIDFCAKYCKCVDGGEPCKAACVGALSTCIPDADDAVSGGMLDACCSSLCADVALVRDESCWEPPAAYRSGC